MERAINSKAIVLVANDAARNQRPSIRSLNLPAYGDPNAADVLKIVPKAPNDVRVRLRSCVMKGPSGPSPTRPTAAAAVEAERALPKAKRRRKLVFNRLPYLGSVLSGCVHGVVDYRNPPGPLKRCTAPQERSVTHSGSHAPES